MRNWNSKCIRGGLMKYLHFILPMRNWNSKSPATIIADRLFYLTYEELKLGSSIRLPVKLLDFILPMRNWNKIGQVEKLLPNLYFILPMRNWNLFGRLFKIWSQVFYLTYEELKQRSEGAIRKKLWRFYLTYEELKLI